MSCDLSARPALNRMRLDATHIPVKDSLGLFLQCTIYLLYHV